MPTTTSPDTMCFRPKNRTITIDTVTRKVRCPVMLHCAHPTFRSCVIIKTFTYLARHSHPKMLQLERPGVRPFPADVYQSLAERFDQRFHDGNAFHARANPLTARFALALHSPARVTCSHFSCLLSFGVMPCLDNMLFPVCWIYWLL